MFLTPFVGVRLWKEIFLHVVYVVYFFQTYVMHGVYNALFNCLSGCMSSKDAALNKITRNLNHLQLKHLHIKLEFM